jgi:SagB-type dehydrogenase family enzyme
MKSKQPDLARLFHLHSCHERCRAPEVSLDWDTKPVRYRTYPGARRIPLPGRDLDIDAPLGDVIARRRSIRDYVLRPMPLATLGRLLHATHGIKGQRDDGELFFTRPAPSAGGLYPIEIYVAIQFVEGLDDGIYHYDPQAHELELVRAGLAHPALTRISLDQTMVLGANVVAILTAVPERTMWKYGQRGYRYVWLDAGHIGQNLYLVGTALGLGAVGIGGFFDRELNELLGLPPGEEAIYLVCLGHPDPAKEVAR